MNLASNEDVSLEDVSLEGDKKLSEESDMPDRHRPVKRKIQNTHHRSKSCENEEDRKALLSLRKSHSLRRREGSWDHKREEQRQAEESSQSRAWSRPGRLNNSYWENKAQPETALPPRTPTPRIQMRDTEQEGRMTPVSRYVGAGRVIRIIFFLTSGILPTRHCLARRTRRS